MTCFPLSIAGTPWGALLGCALLLGCQVGAPPAALRAGPAVRPPPADLVNAAEDPEGDGGGLALLRWTTAGAEALATGDPALACLWLDRVVERGGASPAVHFLRGVARFERGELAAAERDLRAALALDPGDVATHCALSRVLFAGGDADAALASLDAAVALDEADPRLHVLLGHVSLQAGRWPEAFEAFLRAVELDPREVDAHRGLAVLFSEVGDGEHAVAAWLNLIELLPGDAVSWAGLGNAHRDLGRPADALEAYETATRLDPDNPVHLANVASSLQQLGRLDESRRAFERVLASDLPDGEGRAFVTYNYALLLGLLNDDEDALDALELALAEDPDFPEAEQELGMVHLMRGETDLARLHLGRALALGGLSPEGLLELALLHERAGAAEEARDCAELLRAASSRHPEVAFRYARLLVSSRDPAIRDAPRAIGIVRDLLAGPLGRHGALWNLLGEALVEEGAFESALQAAERALHYTHPENPAWQHYQLLRTHCLSALAGP